MALPLCLLETCVVVSNRRLAEECCDVIRFISLSVIVAYSSPQWFDWMLSTAAAFCDSLARSEEGCSMTLWVCKRV